MLFSTQQKFLDSSTYQCSNARIENAEILPNHFWRKKTVQRHLDAKISVDSSGAESVGCWKKIFTCCIVDFARRNQARSYAENWTCLSTINFIWYTFSISDQSGFQCGTKFLCVYDKINSNLATVHSGLDGKQTTRSFRKYCVSTESNTFKK